MKATLEFDLYNEEDRDNYKLINMANSFYLILWEFDQYLRSQYKYEDDEKAWDYRQKLNEVMTDHGVNLDVI